MTHLIQITPAGDINTLDWDETATPLAQLRAALSTSTVDVDHVIDVPHSRGRDLGIWIDRESLDNDGRLNTFASAYAGAVVIGTAAIGGYDSETGDETGLPPERTAVERDNIRAAADRWRARLSFLI